MEAMKHTARDTVEQWKQQIKDSPGGCISLDFTEELVLIYTKIILKALFGEDVSHLTVDFIDLKTGETKALPLHKALQLPLPQLVGKFYNPLRMLSEVFIPMHLTTYDVRV